eukprot:338261-Amphidinium_carterae.4
MARKQVEGEHDRCSIALYVPRRLSCLKSRHWRQLQKEGFDVVTLRKLVQCESQHDSQKVPVHAMSVEVDAGQHVDENCTWDAYPEYYDEVYDTTTGAKLDPTLVAAGRKEEMSFLRQLQAYS